MPLGLEALGFLAGTLTALCFLPQAIRVLVSRETEAISLASQIAFTSGCALWVVFGFYAGSASIMVFNSISAILGGAISVMKFRFGRASCAGTMDRSVSGSS